MPSDNDTKQNVPSEARSDNNSASPTVVALRMKSLSFWVIKRVVQFPRQHEFTIGARWIETCLNVQSCLVEASYQHDKRSLILSASRALVRARVLSRMAEALRCISHQQNIREIEFYPFAPVLSVIR